MRKHIAVSFAFVVVASCFVAFAPAQEEPAAPTAPAEEGVLMPQDAEPVADEAATRSLTLDEAVSKALRANLGLRVSGYYPLIYGEEIGRALSDFDPSVSSALSYSSLRSTYLTPTRPLTSARIWNMDLAWGRRTFSGASLTLSSSSAATRTNDPLMNFVNTYYSTDFAISLTQPLLKGAGYAYNRSGITIAQNNFRISTFEFEERVMDLVYNVSSGYWDLVFFHDDLKVKEKSLQAARDLLRNTEIELEAGSATEIDVKRAKASVAEREQQIVLSRAAIAEAEDRMRSLMGESDSDLLSTAPIVPVDAPAVHAQAIDVAEAVGYALAARPEMQRQEMLLQSYDIIVSRAKNQLLPQVDLVATYTLNGLGTSWHDDFELMGTFDDRDIVTGITLRVPLGNRRARSEYARSRYERLQALVGYAIAQRDITLAVKRAIRDVETSIQSVETSQVRIQASAAQLEAEQNKYEAGVGISLDVLDAQEALQRAESALIASRVSFNKALSAYNRQTGRILTRCNITVVPAASVQRDEQPLFP